MVDFGGMLVLLGGAILLAGILLMVSDRIPLIGRLPGDIYVKKDGFRFFFPIATSIVISVVISAVLWLISYLKGK